jgi:hypothetical protein
MEVGATEERKYNYLHSFLIPDIQAAGKTYIQLTFTGNCLNAKHFVCMNNSQV